MHLYYLPGTRKQQAFGGAFWSWLVADDPVGCHIVASGEAPTKRKAVKALHAAWREQAGLPPQNLPGCPALWWPKSMTRWNRTKGGWTLAPPARCRVVEDGRDAALPEGGPVSRYHHGHRHPLPQRGWSGFPGCSGHRLMWVGSCLLEVSRVFRHLPDSTWVWSLAERTLGDCVRIADGEVATRRKAQAAALEAWRKVVGLPPRRIGVVRGGPAVLRDQATGRTFPLVDMSF